MKLLIVGAGGHGRCCLDIAKSMKIYDEICFLDDKNTGGLVNDSRIIGAISDMNSYHDAYENIFIAVGNNELRKALILKAEKFGYNLVSLISPYSTISSFARIGKGSVIFPNVVVEANASLN